MRIFRKKETIRRVLRYFDYDKDKLEPNPERDWVLICSSFLLAGFFAIFFYKNIFGLKEAFIDYGMSSATSTEISVIELSGENLNKTLKPWIEKDKKFEELLEIEPNFDFLK